MMIVPVPCLRDNYAYLLSDESGDRAVVVDPSEAAPVVEALAQRGQRLTAILCTHHHYDHVGGIEELLRRWPGIPVYGHEHDQAERRIPGQTHGLGDGARCDVLGQTADAAQRSGAPSIEVLHIPGHTLGAIAYYLPDENALFTGDTLFGAGCGRLFEGTPQMMYASLSRLLSLPPSTRIYCGHEYTEANLRFAAAVEPDNEAIRSRRDRVAALRAAGEPSVPSMLGEEAQTNPFLRTSEASVRMAAARQDPGLSPDALDADIFGALRRWKDQF